MIRRIDIETVMLCAMAAIIGAFGVVAGFAAFTGIRFQECNSAVLVGSGCTLGGILWGILLIFNSNRLSKRI